MQRVGFFALWLGVALLSLPERARACMNAVELDTVAAARLVARAEKALEERRHRAVLSMLARVHPLGEDRIRSPSLARRAAKLVAIAKLGTGQIPTAVRMLRELLKAEPADPVLRTYLGVALTHQVRTRGQAYHLLADLDRRDLIVAPEGYVALAFLRGLMLEPKGRDRALARCRAMAPAGAASLCS